MRNVSKGTTRALFASLCAVLVTVAVVVGVNAQPQQSAQTSSATSASSQVSAQAGSNSTEKSQPAEAEENAEEYAIPEGVVAPDYSGSEYVPGELLVTPAEGVTSEEIAEMLGATVLDDANGFIQLQLPDGSKLEEATVKLQVEGLAEAAQPNYVYHTQEAESDDLRTRTAEMLAAGSLKTQDDDVDPYINAQWALTSINAQEGWSMLDGVSDRSVTVAVIDEGFDVDHEDLSANVRARYDATLPHEIINNTNVDVHEEQANRHGTHAAGIIAAQANNGKGIAGVGYNKVGLFLAKVYNSAAPANQEITTTTMARAMKTIIKHAQEYNIRVINVSIGTEKLNVSDASGDDKIFLDEITNALDADIVTVCSAGNKGNQLDNYPGDYKDALSVIALDKSGDKVVRSSSSNYNPAGKNDGAWGSDGSYIREISAPGVSILSTVTSGFNGDYYTDTTLYGYLSGTSMAAPYVSGTLALMFAKNPDLSARGAVERLHNTAKDVQYTNDRETAGEGPDIYTGWGEVNVEAALGNNETQDQKDLANAKVTYTSSKTYTGSAITLSDITVKLAGKTLTSSDYTVEYSNNTNAGTATFTIKPKSGTSWTGSNTKTFTINPKDLSSGGITVANIPNQAYTGKGIVPKPQVKDGSKVLVEGTDYDLTGYSNVSVGTATLYIRGKGADGKSTGNYKGMISRPFTITKASLSNASVTLPKTQYTYTSREIKPEPTVTLGGNTLSSKEYSVTYSNNVNVGTATVTVTGKGNTTGSKSTNFKIVQSSNANNGGSSSNSGSNSGNSGTNNNSGSNSNNNSSGGGSSSVVPDTTAAAKSYGVTYRTHVQNDGWQRWMSNGQTAGTSGRSLRLEGINVNLSSQPYAGSIEYRTHVQNIGWQDWRSNGAMAGTSGMSLRLEAIQIRLTGEMAQHYDVYYRVHAQNIGWMSWAKNGEQAGTAGYGYRLEAIQIKLVPKGYAKPSMSPSANTSEAFRTNKIEYRTHVQNVGWQSYVADGSTSGTTGRSYRLEGINIRFGSQSGISGSVRYRTHIQNIGWESSWKYNGEMSGTSGRALRLEAIQIALEGDAANQYDVYYRVHAQNFGWMGWAKNGEQAGTAGYAYRLEGIQIELVPKGGAAPGSTSNAFRQR